MKMRLDTIVLVLSCSLVLPTCSPPCDSGYDDCGTCRDNEDYDEDACVVPETFGEGGELQLRITTDSDGNVYSHAQAFFFHGQTPPNRPYGTPMGGSCEDWRGADTILDDFPLSNSSEVQSSRQYVDAGTVGLQSNSSKLGLESHAGEFAPFIGGTLPFSYIAPDETVLDEGTEYTVWVQNISFVEGRDALGGVQRSPSVYLPNSLGRISPLPEELLAITTSEDLEFSWTGEEPDDSLTYIQFFNEAGELDISCFFANSGSAVIPAEVIEQIPLKGNVVLSAVSHRFFPYADSPSSNSDDVFRDLRWDARGFNSQIFQYETTR